MIEFLLLLIKFLVKVNICDINDGCSNTIISSIIEHYKRNHKRELFMKIFSSAFGNFEDIPIKYTGDDQDVSPPLRWQDIPAGTRSLALICDDPDAPHGTWDHWIIYNIPPTISVLAEGIKPLPQDIQSCVNSWGKKDYRGPKPPSGMHRYFFKLYALDTVFQLPEEATKIDLIKGMNSHILAEATLVGHYAQKDGH